MTNLFAKDTQQNTVSNRGNQLNSTARLTQLSQDIARELLTTFESDLDTWQENVIDSQEDHDSMDALIKMVHNLEDTAAQFELEEEEDVIDRMIKSQQSKRSRAKSKEMTRENYLTMLTGAIAENILRIKGNKPKSSGGGGARRVAVGYTEEELEALANDPEALRRAIRNVQSKKSIDKSKANFDETSERWQELLEAEQSLIAIRDGQSVEAEKALEANAQVEEMLSTIDPKDLKAADAKDMLENIKQMLASK